MKKQTLQTIFRKGKRILLLKMDGEPQMPCGLVGSVTFVDDFEQIHVNWENGSSLALNQDVDEFLFLEDTDTLIESAVLSRYKGYVVLSKGDYIYLGKKENYLNGMGVYDNADNSLMKISGNPNMFHFLGMYEGYTESQKELIKQSIFTDDDYREYARIKRHLKRDIEKEPDSEIKFGIDPFMKNTGINFSYPNY